MELQSASVIRPRDIPIFESYVTAVRHSDALLHQGVALLLQRPWFEQGEDSLEYDNRDTGCRFVLRLPAWRPRKGLSHVPAPVADALTIQAEALKPSTYPLEVAEEIGWLSKQIPLKLTVIVDSVPVTGPWLDRRFQQGWQAVNSPFFADQFSGKRMAGCLPQARIHEVWTWNRSRQQRQDDLAVDAFIPLVLYASLGEYSPVTVVTWKDLMPVLLPRVDYILAAESTTGSDDDPGKARITWVPWNAIAPLVQRYPEVPGFPGARQLLYDHPPDQLRAALRSGLLVRQRPQILSAAQVLDQEYMNAF